MRKEHLQALLRSNLNETQTPGGTLKLTPGTDLKQRRSLWQEVAPFALPPSPPPPPCASEKIVPRASLRKFLIFQIELQLY